MSRRSERYASLLLASSESESMIPDLRLAIHALIQELDGNLWRGKLALALAEEDVEKRKEMLGRLYSDTIRRLTRLREEREKLEKIEEKINDQLPLL